MKLSAVVMLLKLFSSFSEDMTELDDDTTLLLQTRAASQQVKKRNLNLHRFLTTVNEGGVSLLRNDLEMSSGDVVYFKACAVDEAGVGAEVEDEVGSQIDTCGPMVIFDHMGKALGSLTICSPESIPEGTCYVFPESAGWFNDFSSSSTVYHVQASDASQTSDVLLINIPDFDSSKVSIVADKVKKLAGRFPASPVLFYGDGSKLLEERWIKIAFIIASAVVNGIADATRPEETGDYYMDGEYLSNYLENYYYFIDTCVAGANLISYEHLFPEECATKCDENSRCKGFEYGRRGERKGQCRLQSDDNTDNCNGAYYLLDFALPRMGHTSR